MNTSQSWTMTDETVFSLGRLELELELRKTHGGAFATAYLEEFDTQVRTANRAARSKNALRFINHLLLRFDGRHNTNMISNIEKRRARGRFRMSLAINRGMLDVTERGKTRALRWAKAWALVAEIRVRYSPIED